ncbi:MAG: TerB family tellurite resistance protein, partial [Desulfobacterales bacterium]|nr:TerB family tellurite resistance protein [Desulfobacterales bacterium]
MLNIVKRYFSKVKEGSPDASGQETGHDIHVATCALLVEIARIDGTFSQEEMETVISILKEKYGLS